MPAIQLTKVRQAFDSACLTDIETSTRKQLDNASLKIKPGDRIAVAVGSRGIANLFRIVKTTVDWLREKQAEPFILPAMGSHGGATAEGQLEVLSSYGITKQSIGCPIRASMEVIEMPQADLEVKPYLSREAQESDGVILINRIKPHTDFHGTYESGLVKMTVIGLGKERQANEIHRFGIYGLRNLIPKVAARTLNSGKILLGLAIVENAYDETAIIEAIKPEEILQREPALLDLAKTNMPSLPLDKFDVLIIDQMGKDISGAGLDTNIIGRLMIRGEREPQRPDIKMIIVTDLTEASHGNATGTGLADLITRRLFDKIDFQVTYTNTVTSAFLERGKLPIVAENDQQALDYALRACGAMPAGSEKIIRIKDTLHLAELYVSQAALDEISGNENISAIGQPVDLFDEAGNLNKF